MEKNIRLGYLYDFYGELLPEHGREVLGRIVEDDLSLSELSEEMGVTRQAVHDVKKRAEKALEEYEKKLGLMEKYLNLKGPAVELCELAGVLSERYPGDPDIKRLAELSGSFMENI